MHTMAISNISFLDRVGSPDTIQSFDLMGSLRRVGTNRGAGDSVDRVVYSHGNFQKELDIRI
jgi:hypothetical protein